MSTDQRYLTNPLWTWRIANRRDAVEVELILRWPRGRVERLELGGAEPSARELKQLAGLTGLRDVAERWTAWRSGARPA